MHETLREKIHRQLEPTAWDKEGLSPANAIIMIVVLASVALAIL